MSCLDSNIISGYQYMASGNDSTLINTGRIHPFTGHEGPYGE